MRDTTNLMAFGQGTVTKGGLMGLSWIATRGNRGNSPYSQHVQFFTHLNNEDCDGRLVLCCCLAMHDCLVRPPVLCFA